MVKKEPLDARSTGRKRGRTTLIKVRRPFLCDESERGCGRGPTKFPDTYPPHLRDESLLADPEDRVEGLELEANHINKNILDNDPVNLEWLCKKCHKNADMLTEKGVSVLQDEQGYGIAPW